MHSNQERNVWEKKKKKINNQISRLPIRQFFLLPFPYNVEIQRQLRKNHERKKKKKLVLKEFLYIGTN